MIKIYVHNSIHDYYSIMVLCNDSPVASDYVEGRISLRREIQRLVDEYLNRMDKYKIVGLDKIDLNLASDILQDKERCK